MDAPSSSLPGSGSSLRSIRSRMPEMTRSTSRDCSRRSGMSLVAVTYRARRSERPLNRWVRARAAGSTTIAASSPSSLATSSSAACARVSRAISSFCIPGSCSAQSRGISGRSASGRRRCRISRNAPRRGRAISSRSISPHRESILARSPRTSLYRLKALSRVATSWAYCAAKVSIFSRSARNVASRTLRSASSPLRARYL